MFVPKIIRKLLKQRAMLQFYQPLVRPGDLCFDIGANIGERTDLLLKLGSHVVVVEPQQSCFSVLQQKYGNHPRVTLLKCALGSEAGETSLMICDESSECSTLSMDFVHTYTRMAGFSWRSTETVQVRTLQSLCDTYGVPRFCKVDVEGYESAVFAGLQQPIPQIHFEFNQPLLHDTVKSLERLGALGNYQCNFIQNEEMHLMLNQWLTVPDFCRHINQHIPPHILTGEIVVRL